MLEVVFDINIYISALITKGGKAEEAYIHAIENKIKLFTSIPILTETAKKLREKFHWNDDNIKLAIKNISKTATVIKPSVRISILNDKPDNRILECAIESKAHLIVTGDKHLLNLKQYDGIEMLRISDMLKRVK